MNDPERRRARRADERARSDRPQGGPRPDPRAARRSGKTVFFSSHILTDIEAIADRVAIDRARLSCRRRARRPSSSSDRARHRRSRCASPDDADGRRAVRGAGGARAPRRRRARRSRCRPTPTSTRGSLARASSARARCRVAPRHETLEDLFVRQVASTEEAGVTGMLGRIWAIALNTFREAARIRVLYGIDRRSSSASNLLAIVLGKLSVHEDARVAQRHRARRHLAVRLADRDLPRRVPAVHRGPAPHDPRDRQQADRALGVRRRQVPRHGARAERARRAVRARDDARAARGRAATT